MSWTNELYQVYEKNCGKEDEKILLLPVSHSTANAQVEVTLTEGGDFFAARRIEDKKDSVTVIPVTEDSGSRSSGITPHPFADKLIYIAGDYEFFVADNKKYYQAYLDQLEKWNGSAESHPAVHAVYTYLKKGTLIQDLIREKVLVKDESTGKLLEKEKILGIAQEDVFVRFRINYYDFSKESNTWKDASLQESFIQYNAKQAESEALCYATGKLTNCTYKHPSKIRNAGDKAKLISSNDESGFTYRGRFDSKEQALSMSYDFSQKIHNALKWLIEKQGVPIGSMEVVAWASNLQPLPDIIGDFDEADEDEQEDDFDDLEAEEKEVVFDTMPAYRSRLQKAIWGNHKEEENIKAMIMILDAATTGRLSMTMYEELPVSEFNQNLEKWHYGTAWNRFNGKLRKNELCSFSLYDIADCAYGTEQGDFIKCKAELRSQVILRLIPCVVSGKNLPHDIVENLFHKASRPTAYKNKYNWQKVLETACGMIRKTIIEEKRKRKEQEEYEVALDCECKDRDYLYGRLLAVAEVAEAVTYEKGEERLTNAGRYFEAFSNRPYQTWGILYNRLQTYLNKMEVSQRRYYMNLISEIKDQFEIADFEDNSKLKPVFLLAYHCQLRSLASKKNVSKEEK